MSQMMVLVFSLLLVFIFTKNQNDLSVCAAVHSSQSMIIIRVTLS